MQRQQEASVHRISHKSERLSLVGLFRIGQFAFSIEFSFGQFELFIKIYTKANRDRPFPGFHSPPSPTELDLNQ